MYKTLIYIGDKQDNNIPWGGYHITIAGRNNISLDNMISIVEKNIHYFNLNIDEGIHEWKLGNDHDNISLDNWFIKQYNINPTPVIKIKCSILDNFALALENDGVIDISFIWHITLPNHTSEEALEKLLYFQKQKFNIYVVEWYSKDKIIWHHII